MKNRKKIDPDAKTCEHMTLERAKHLAECGANCAKVAKTKGQTIEDSRGYLYLMGDNNTAAWMNGWENEFNK